VTPAIAVGYTANPWLGDLQFQRGSTHGARPGARCRRRARTPALVELTDRPVSALVRRDRAASRSSCSSITSSRTFPTIRRSRSGRGSCVRPTTRPAWRSWRVSVIRTRCATSWAAPT
jgi:hypothetical protein